MHKLAGKRILITAGPTYEAIDPVRFIGNHSTGKMGAAIAEVAASMNAEVYLVMGPSHLKLTNQAIIRTDVTSAQQMYEACVDLYAEMDVAIMSAAVADYRPVQVAAEKIKKSDAKLTVELEPTPDILAKLGRLKQHQYLVGFALETDNALGHAREKLVRKNADLIVLNSLKDKGAGFGYDTNQVTVLDRNGGELTFGLLSKHEVALQLLNIIAERIH